MTKRSPISNLPALSAVVVCLGLVACGDLDPDMTGTGGTDSDGMGGGGIGDASQLLPLKTGNFWTYVVTDDLGRTQPKTQTVMGEEPVGGSGPNAAVTAFRMVTRKGTDGMHQTVSWQTRVGTRVVRYREQGFSATAPYGLEREDHWDPFKLRVDESPDRMVAGATWLEVHQETKMPVGATPSTTEQLERWSVAAERERVTVQGWSYEVLILRKVGTVSSLDKTYWWARGIGKVKEIGASATEELVSYSVAP